MNWASRRRPWARIPGPRTVPPVVYGSDANPLAVLTGRSWLHYSYVNGGSLVTNGLSGSSRADRVRRRLHAGQRASQARGIEPVHGHALMLEAGLIASRLLHYAAVLALFGVALFP